MEEISDEVREAVRAETGVSIMDLAPLMGEFDELYRTERFGQYQRHAVAAQMEMIEFQTLERVHERWRMFPVNNEQLRAELVGMVGFWIDAFTKHTITHVVEKTVSPHWPFSYAQYVASRLCGVTYLTVYENLYLENTVVHSGLHDRPIRYGPAGIPPKVKAFLEEMADKVSHPPIATTYMKTGYGLYPTARNTFSRVHRGMVVHRKPGNFTKTDMRSRRFARVRYTKAVVSRSFGNYRQFARLAKQYDRLSTPPEIAADEKGRSVIFFAHLQPEATTAPLAFLYHDARMAVRDLIDRGFAVYFKEHPISFQPTIHHTTCLTPDYRPPQYYRDLAEMGCKFIPVHADNDALLDQFDFAATCSGTIAIQAAAKGKWTIAFGRPWFRRMPGLEDASDGLKVSPEELKNRPRPTVPSLIDYFSETHGLGLPQADPSGDNYAYLKGLAEIALEHHDADRIIDAG